MRATAAILFLAAAGLAAAGCETDLDSVQSAQTAPGGQEPAAAANQPGQSGEPWDPADHPRKPNAPTAMNSDPFAPQEPQPPKPDEQTENPFQPGSKGEEEDDDEAGFGTPGGLSFYYCSCLEPGGIAATVGFYACASNPFEAANFSVNKIQCINVNRCIACVCYPGAPCLVKG